jgi:fimbrial isopeptide formation D2 family protein
MRKCRHYRPASIARSRRFETLEILEARVVLSTTVAVPISQVQDVSTYVPGSNTTYTLSVNNTSGSSITGATLTDTLPAGLTFVSATINGSANVPTAGSTTVNFVTSVTETFTLPTLAANSTTSLTLTLTSPSQKPLGSGAGAVTQISNAANLMLPAGYTNSSSPSTSLSTNVGYFVILTDALLTSSAPVGSTSAAITSINPDTGYTLRQLVNYYDFFSNATSIGVPNDTASANQIVVNLEGGTYTFATIASGTQLADQAQLSVNNPNGLSTGRLPLVIENGTINANFQSRVFNVTGASLTLLGVTLENGQEFGIQPTSTGSNQKVDAFGGGIFVGNNGNLTLDSYTGAAGTLGTTIEKCFATAPVGTQVGASVNITRTTRHGVGYNAAGAGIYGAAGSDITIKSSTVIRQNRLKGGHGALVNNSAIGHGGNGGSAFGAGVAIQAPASGTGSSSSNSYAILNLYGGATISNNIINQITTAKGAIQNSGGTGGACSTRGIGGAGGNAQGVGLYIGGGSLILNGTGAVQVTNNIGLSGKAVTSSNGTSLPGVIQGAVFYQPSEVNSAGFTPLTGGAFQITSTIVDPANFGFESPSETGSYLYTPPNANWTFVGGAGISGNGSGFTGANPNAPQGTQVAFIQSGNGQTSGASFSQTLNGLAAGQTYTVNFSAAVRSGNLQQSFQVLANGLVIGTFAPATTSYRSYQTSAFTVPNNGTVALSFIGLNPNNTDETDFIDNVTLQATGLFLPTVTTAVDSALSFTSGWNLRTAVAAANALAITGSAVSLNLPAATLSLSSGNGPLSINSAQGSVSIVGSGGSSSIISAGTSTGSIFSVTNAAVSFTKLGLKGANVSSGNGGAINAANANVALSSVSIKSNSVSATSGNGGGIYQSGGTLTVTNSVLTNNHAGYGGALSMGGGTSTINGSTLIKSNTATYFGGAIESVGGAILNAAAVGISSNKVTLNGNSSLSGTGFGGGLFANGGSSLNLSGTKINKNTATNGGGGVAVSAGTLNISSQATISNNSVTNGSGGGVFVNGASNTTISGSTITANSVGAGQGAGLYYDAPGTGKLTSDVVSSNTATGGMGGGMFLAAGTLRVTGAATAINNNAASSGGGVYVNDAKLSFKNGQIKGNKSVNSGAGLTLTNSTSAAPSARLTSALISSNIGSSSSSLGGGIYQYSGSLNLTNSTVQNNTAASGGGVFINALAGNASTIKNSKIAINNASINGGGLEFNGLSSSQQLNLTTAIVTRNAVNGSAIVGGGGGLYLSGGTVNASGITVSSNNVTSSTNVVLQGGGVYNSGSTVNFSGTSNTINNNSLTGNGTSSTSATAFGAGLAVLNSGILAGGSPLSIQNNTITNTYYGVGGGAAFFTSAQMNVTGTCTLLGNKTPSGGYDYAFTVTNLGDNNTVPSGLSGINTFTNGTNTLRGALQFAANLMNASTTLSVGIMLTSAGGTTNASGNYKLNNQTPLSTSLTTSAPLTIIGTGVQASIQGVNNRVVAMSSGTVVLQNLNIVGGNALNGINSTDGTGGGIKMTGGNLTLNAVTVQGNQAGYNNFAVAGLLGGGTAVYANNGHAANGGAGAAGLSGYGGGIYLGGGTLNLLSNCSITGNNVYGQNGGSGGSGNPGYVNFHVDTCDAEDTSRVNGGNGGRGGSGGQANGGGLYQAGGTLNSQSGGNIITGNSSTPGTGGNGGNGGGGGSTSHSECGYNYNRTSNPGSPGVGGNSNSQTGLKASGVANYENGGNGNSILSAKTVGTPLAIRTEVGGLYQSAGSLNTTPLRATETALLSSTGRTAIPGITVELHSENGALIATTQSDQTGHFVFDTTFTGKGYIQLIKPAIFDVVAKGGSFGSIKSRLDPKTLRSDSAQFIDGYAVNTSLSFALKKAPLAVRVGTNGITMNRTDSHQSLFSDQLMPKSYKGGFTVAKFDTNGDQTDDYILITKKGTPQLFIVDGRTGEATHITGPVAPALQAGMVIRPVSLTGGTNQQFLLLPSGDRPGKITAIDLTAKSVLWTAASFPTGRITVNTVNANDPTSPFASNVTITSRHFADAFEVLDGTTGELKQLIFNGYQIVIKDGTIDPLDIDGVKLLPTIRRLVRTLSATQTTTDTLGNSHRFSYTNNPVIDLDTPGSETAMTPAATPSSVAIHDAVLAKTSVKELHYASRSARSR